MSELINEYFFMQNQFGNDSRKTRNPFLIILAIPAIFAIACMIPASATSFSPEGGTFFEPVEIMINSTIDAWTEVQPETDTLKAYRWRYNPAAFAIISGDDHSRNVTFRAIKETKKPEAISYGSKDCSDTSHKDSPCSASETASQKYW